MLLLPYPASFSQILATFHKKDEIRPAIFEAAPALFTHAFLYSETKSRTIYVLFLTLHIRIVRVEEVIQYDRLLN